MFLGGKLINPTTEKASRDAFSVVGCFLHGTLSMWDTVRKGCGQSSTYRYADEVHLPYHTKEDMRNKSIPAYFLKCADNKTFMLFICATKIISVYILVLK